MHPFDPRQTAIDLPCFQQRVSSHAVRNLSFVCMLGTNRYPSPSCYSFVRNSLKLVEQVEEFGDRKLLKEFCVHIIGEIHSPILFENVLDIRNDLDQHK